MYLRGTVQSVVFLEMTGLLFVTSVESVLGLAGPGLSACPFHLKCDPVRKSNGFVSAALAGDSAVLWLPQTCFLCSSHRAAGTDAPGPGYSNMIALILVTTSPKPFLSETVFLFGF